MGRKRERRSPASRFSIARSSSMMPGKTTMSAAETCAPTSQSELLSRPSMVRASPATTCIARVTSSARSSMFSKNTA